MSDVVATAAQFNVEAEEAMSRYSHDTGPPHQLIDDICLH
jgi:hypothetical protein